MGHKYRSGDSMSSLIADDYRLLHVLSRFGITLGFGDKTVDEVCREAGVDSDTLLAVCNFISGGIRPTFDEFGLLDIGELLRYLTRSHAFFLDFLLPALRRKFVNAVDCSTRNDVGFLLLKFFDDYVAEVKRHQEYEQETLFRYVEGLMQGRRTAGFGLQDYEATFSHESHKSMDDKLADLKSIIIRYSPPSNNALALNDALLHLFEFEADHQSHCQFEDMVFIPAVSLLEAQVEIQSIDAVDAPAAPAADEGELSQREREIITCVVKGQTNKEIADALCISIHTVLTHRRNIAKKLDIHSPAGLVIYAIVNGIVSVDDIKDTIC